MTKIKNYFKVNQILKNLDESYFNKIAYEAILYFIEKKEIEAELVKNLKNIDFIDFKLVYDICLALDIDMKDLIERMEGNFLK